MTKKIAYASVFTAVITILTMGSIPIPGGGYIHIGDSIIFLCCFILPMPFALLAAGIGSFFADFIIGYTLYAPFTLVIKAAMAVIARLFVAKNDNMIIAILGFLLASLVMQTGYFFVNLLYFKYETSVIIVLINLVQTVASVPIAYFLIKAVGRIPDLQNVRNLWRKT